MLNKLLLVTLIVAAPTLARSLKALTDFADRYEAPTLSPDGRTLLYQFSCEILSRAAGGGPQKPFARSDHKDGCPANPRWSPDGNNVAFLRMYCHHCHHALFLKGYPNGVERKLGDVCGSPVAWTLDARFLIAAEPIGDGGDVCRLVNIPVDGGRRIRLLKSEGDVAALSPDGKRLAYRVRPAAR